MNRKANNLKQITIKDVAQAAGVSIATVSRVLNQQEGVSKELSEQVQIAVKQLNYQINGIAKALKSSQSRSIGLIIPDIENPFFPALVRGVEDAAQKQGYAVILCNTDGKPEEEERYLKFLLSKQVDGILFLGNLKFSQNRSWLSALSVPLVLVDRRMKDAPFSTVLVDNGLGASMAVDHLIAQGRQHIAIVGGKPESPTSMERVNGAMNCLKSHGYSSNESLILTGYFSFEGGYQATESLINSGQFFDAIFAANDMMAIGAIECLANYGKRVPDDVAVIGFDDIRMAAWYKPSLTTIKQPVYDMGQVAVKLIVDHITGVITDCNDEILKPELIVRQSSGGKGDRS
ncbi:LacI family DNA-binding transcriptional regulator [Pelosinus sp. sgz500959]|uniref:LacI family DNA-binding transcriptional regulator n=1 Tax=Pelosinus sp. sgz500959 TaxID=3242472 RepID=UPI003671059D